MQQRAPTSTWVRSRPSPAQSPPVAPTHSGEKTKGPQSAPITSPSAFSITLLFAPCAPATQAFSWLFAPATGPLHLPFPLPGVLLLTFCYDLIPYPLQPSAQMSPSQWGLSWLPYKMATSLNPSSPNFLHHSFLTYGLLCLIYVVYCLPLSARSLLTHGLLCLSYVVYCLSLSIRVLREPRFLFALFTAVSSGPRRVLAYQVAQGVICWMNKMRISQFAASMSSKLKTC